jgi:hypothetical protein
MSGVASHFHTTPAEALASAFSTAECGLNPKTQGGRS